jgi:hypothetical protein
MNARGFNSRINGQLNLKHRFAQAVIAANKGLTVWVGEPKELWQKGQSLNCELNSNRINIIHYSSSDPYSTPKDALPPCALTKFFGLSLIVANPSSDRYVYTACPLL